MLSNKPQFHSYSLEGIRSGRTVKEERQVQCKPRSLCLGVFQVLPGELHFSLHEWPFNCTGGEEGVGGNLLAWIK